MTILSLDEIHKDTEMAMAKALQGLISERKGGSPKTRCFMVVNFGPFQLVTVMCFKFEHWKASKMIEVMQKVSKVLDDTYGIRAIFTPLDGTENPMAGAIVEMSDTGFVNISPLSE